MKYRFILLLGIASVFTMPAMAEVLHFKAELTPQAEVPAVHNSRGKGSVEVHFDTRTRRLVWQSEQSGLSGPATMAHFRGPADPTKNANVQIPVSAGQLGHKGRGDVKLTNEQAKQLMDGLWYFNYHTKAHPGGEIRGQVLRVKQ
ncbi:CHRD domain-containing protein [Brucella melitensis]|uniref:CHRD domain-containing protein n=1 Tax=Brucella melitensis TaxID=29459 RepID=UPI000F8CC3DC|nr:CHRD domain-containing protein [Brucella melitensis]RUQ53704.1 CHRD domain-containing protein [Brucella melitensis]RUQ63344.1 CHRD domain-containing protein [Brucella melitensis]RUQ71967.1 CHRD domain-containing protein [Brucella melitensis]RUQ80941.1 CHRD domain-containing protein [Brucella melitensis]